MRHFVRDEGRRDAPICVVGEAPGRVENARGLPFQGPAGTTLNGWLARVGLQRRRDIYITNTYPYLPDGKLEEVPRAERDHWIDELHTRIAALDDPIVLVPMGNHALQALTGKWGITHHRGSIYRYVDRRGRKLKVIPTIHPAATFGGRNQGFYRRCVLDWKRIVRDRAFRALRLPKRGHFIMPTLKDCADYVEAARAGAEVLAIDVETPIAWKTEVIGRFKNGKPKTKKTKGPRFVACVGFAFAPDFSLTIPTTLSYWGTRDKLHAAWQLVKELCELPCAKVMQNGFYDAFHFARLGIRVRNWRWDTKAMHHALWPNDAHSLEYLASIDTREPYWKDEGKTEDRGIPKDLPTWWTYCGKDAAVTRELCDVYEDRLRRANRLPYYHAHYRRLFAPMLAMSVEGIAVDEVHRTARYMSLLARRNIINIALETAAKEPLFGPKGTLSHTRLARFLYGTLALPVQKAKNTKGDYTVTTREVAVRKLMIRYQKHAELQRTGAMILEQKRLDKLKQFYAESIVGADGRAHCSYGFTPESGRFSSTKDPMGSGENQQNLDREARDWRVPDAGHVFVNVDLSTAESRIVFCLTQDGELIRKARLPPWEYDSHLDTATIIFGTTLEKLRVLPKKEFKEKRFVSKQTSHASHYGEQGKTMAESMLKEGFVFTPEECQTRIDDYLARRPAIAEVFQRNVRRRIMTDKRVENTWGRVLDFSYDRIDQSVFRRGYAFMASSEVAGIINQYGLLPLWRAYRRDPEVRLRQQGHDSLLISCAPGRVWEVWQFLREQLERPRVYQGVELTIPATLTIGPRWGVGREFKQPPSRRDVRRAVEETMS